MPLRDLSANLIGPFVVVLAVHVGLAQTLPSGGRAAIATGALGGYMLVSTLQAAHTALEEGVRTVSSLTAIAAAAVGCLMAGVLSLGLARCFS
jgi:fluoride ion exporter CrcB/FEX